MSKEIESKEEQVVVTSSNTVPKYESWGEKKKPGSFTFFTERYFSHYKAANCKGVEGNNARLLLHSNCLCVLCVDPSHEIFTKKMEVESVTHSQRGRGGKERDMLARAANVKGKKKAGAVQCEKEMMLAIITTKCGKTFKIPACIDGQVLEVNPFLSQDPSVLVNAPLSEGFIAVINPKVGTKFDGFELLSAATSGELVQED